MLIVRVLRIVSRRTLKDARMPGIGEVLSINKRRDILDDLELFLFTDIGRRSDLIAGCSMCYR